MVNEIERAILLPSLDFPRGPSHVCVEKMDLVFCW